MPPINATTLTSIEAAELLRRTPVTLERWRRLRIGPPYFRIHGRVLYDRVELETWMAEQKRATLVELND